MMNVDLRNQILQELNELNEAYKKVAFTTLDPDDSEVVVDEVLEEEMDAEANRLWEVILTKMEAYKEVLEDVAVSRCPFTGEAVTMAMDTLGLDGRYWNAEGPIRRVVSLPKTFFAVDGAMTLGTEIPSLPYLVAPGPDVPFVIPRLLEFEQVKCVLSLVQIGTHKGYMMVYYASPKLQGELRINDWGTNRYWEDEALIPSMMSPGQYINVDIDPDDYDYDLAKWVRRGKLLWIQEQDTSLTLRSTLQNCPYLDLEGQQSPKFIYEGKVTYDEIDYEFAEEDQVDMDVYRAALEQLNSNERSEE